MQIKIGNTAALLRALKTARDGDVILLEQGSYSGVDIRSASFANLTIQSLDPAKPAVLNDLHVRGSSGLTFRHLELVVDPSKSRSFQVLDSKNISLDKLHVHGTMNGNPADDASGIMIRNSSNVSVTGSEFQQLWHAIEFLDSNKLSFMGNSFHDIRTDGIRGGGASDVLISKNSFTNFYPAPGDHGNAIQLWTTNTTSAAKNIVISENMVTRGAGGIVQGIFMRDTFDNLPFENVTIVNNIVVGAMYNGIAVDGAKNLKISDNTVVAFADMKSWIRVEKSDLVTVQNNKAAEFLYIGSTLLSQIGNEKNGRASDGGEAAIEQWSTQFEAGMNATVRASDLPKLAAAKASQAGSAGNDTLLATQHPGGTTLDGRNGNDTLRGGKHDDFLVGGGGDDQLTGGGGADQFRFFGTQIEGPADVDRITDLNFSQGDTLVFGSFGLGTFADAAGVNSFSGGGAASISSYAGIVNAAALSDQVTAYRASPGSSNLVLQIIDSDGQIQKIVIVGGYGQYIAAGGADGL